MVNTDTVPAARLATSARVPSGEMRTVAAPAPARRCCTAIGGLAVRSTTVTWSSGPMPAGRAGSARVAEVTMAKVSSLLTATAVGGPTTLPGTSMVAVTLGGDWDRSMTDRVSGAASGGATWAPLDRTVWASLDDSATSARAGAQSAARVAAARVAAPGCQGPGPHRHPHLVIPNAVSAAVRYAALRWFTRPSTCSRDAPARRSGRGFRSRTGGPARRRRAAPGRTPRSPPQARRGR